MLGVNEDDAELDNEAPLEFVAVDVKVYAVPDVRPETVTGLVPVPVKDPGEDVTVYEVIACPPVALLLIGTDADTVDPYAASATLDTEPTVGAWGTVVIVAELDAADAKAFPYPLVAVTVKVNAVLEGIPVTTIGEEDPEPE